MRALKYYSLSEFQLYNTVLSTVVTMLYVRSSDLIHLITEKFPLFVRSLSYHKVTLMTSYKPNYLPKVTPPNPITLGLRVSTWILGSVVQSVTLPRAHMCYVECHLWFDFLSSLNTCEMRYTSETTVGLCPDFVWGFPLGSCSCPGIDFRYF